MSYLEYQNAKVYYEKKGSKQPMILLHGWGQNTEMMQFIQDHFAPYFTVYNLDFPGFGKSELPTKSMSVHDYADFLAYFCKELAIENPILIGHSFGCRVAMRYASNHQVKKMVLTGAAGLKDKHSLAYYFKVGSYKVGKKILLSLGLKNQLVKFQQHFGSADYKNSAGVIRETFVKVVNDDVSDCLAQIEAETLLVYGENDQATPLWMGKKLEQEIKNSALVIFENDDHYAYFHQSRRFLLVLEAFLAKDMGE